MTEHDEEPAAEEVEEQGIRYGGREDDATASTDHNSEVEEQAGRWGRESESGEESEDSDEDSEVDEQHFTGSDARLKHSFAVIEPLA